MSLLNFPGLVLFTERYEFFAFPVLHLKGKLNLVHIIVQNFFDFFSLNAGQSRSFSWSRSRSFFPAPDKKSGSGS